MGKNVGGLVGEGKVGQTGMDGHCNVALASKEEDQGSLKRRKELGVTMQ